MTGKIGALATNRALTPDLIAETVLVSNTELEPFSFNHKMVVRLALSFERVALATSNPAPSTVKCQPGHLGVNVHPNVEVVNNCALVTLS